MRGVALILTLAAAPMCVGGVQVRLPEFSREVLPNGTVLLMCPRPGLPLVHLHISVRGGVESEPEGVAGVAAATADLLRRGAGTRTADQFSRELDMLGGTFESRIDDQATLIDAEFLTKNIERGLDLVSDALLRPSFAEDETTKAIAQLKDQVRAAHDEPSEAIRRYWQAYYFGSSHPYGRPPDESTLSRIRRSEIAAYHKRLYVGSNMIVAVTGDFAPSNLRRQLLRAFGAAPGGERYVWVRPAPAASRSARLLLVDKPDATQTYMSIGMPGIRRDDPDRFAIKLINTLIGGRFTSLLNDELRVNAGLTYFAISSVQQSRLQGAIVISTFTATDTTGKVIDSTLDILRRVREKGLTQAQLDSARAYVKGTFPTAELETIDQIAATLATLELFGMGPGEINNLFAQLDAVTLEQCNEVLRRYYRDSNLTFVLLGDASRIRDSVRKYAPEIRERSIRQSGWSE